MGGFLVLGLFWAALLAASAVAGLGPFRLSKSAFVAAPFLLAALPVVFAPTPEPLAQVDIGPLTLTISRAGLILFATIALKSWLSVQAALLLTFTTPFHDLIDALRDLHLPRILVGIISFMYRYMAVIGDEAQRLLRARAARSAAVVGAPSGGSLGWRARVTGSMAGSLFLRSYERSERIYAAMQARGFDGTFVHIRTRPITLVEWAAVILLVAVEGGLVIAAYLWLPHG